MKEELINALMDKLDTRDKRYMFLKITFKEILPNINIEGSPKETSLRIYEEFKKQCMLGSLIACMNSYLDCNLHLHLDH